MTPCDARFARVVRTTFGCGAVALLVFIAACSSGSDPVFAPPTIDPTGNWQVTLTPGVNGCDLDEFVQETVSNAVVLNGTMFTVTDEDCDIQSATYADNKVTLVDSESIADGPECTLDITSTVTVNVTSATSLSGTISIHIVGAGSCDGVTCPGDPACECTSTATISAAKGGAGPACP